MIQLKKEKKKISGKEQGRERSDKQRKKQK